MQLTAKAVEALKAPDTGTRVITDQGFKVPGLVCRLELRIGKTRKTWALFYKLDAKRTRRNLGHYRPGMPGHMGLAEARAEAMRRAALLVESKDPFGGAKPKGSIQRFEDLLEGYVAYISEPISDSGEPRLRTWRNRAWALRRRTQELQGLDVREITTPQLRDLVRKVRFDLKMESEAVQLNVFLKRFWDWLEETGVVESNPAVGIKVPPPPKPKKVPLTPEELGRFWNILEADSANAEPALAIKALALQLATLTALRCQECILTSWAEFDHSRRWLTIPVTRYDQEGSFIPGFKSTAKIERIHDVYVGTPQAQRVITRIDEIGRELYRARSGEPHWLFPNPSTLYPYSKSSYDSAVTSYRERTGIKLGFHLLRHTFSTMAEDPKYIGFDPYNVGFVLGHTPGGTTEQYIHRNRSRIRKTKKEVASQWHEWVEKFGHGVYT